MVQLVATKLAPPRLRTGLIGRGELVDRLIDGRTSALTLVCAPAGYGKTTLLAQWASSDLERRPFAWVSLDAADSDPVRLWSYLIAALSKVHGQVGERSLPALAAGPQSISATVLPLLVDELVSCPPLVVVLEDWHSVRNPLCDETVEPFVDRAPEQIQIVISSRSDPGLPIARLRAHGDLAEIRGRDLRISPTEVTTLFEQAGLRLRASDAHRLAERTEGWLAGLSLAVILLREQEDPGRFVRAFSGDSRHVFDYLASDVLSLVEPGAREFMVQSSILDRLSGPLCDAVLERSGSAALLAELERSNLFLVALDETGSEYRYHHLFAAMLQRELEATAPGAVPELHARASRWYEEQGDVEHAVDHAIASRDVPRVSALVTVVSIPFLSAGRIATVNRWFEALSWPEAHADRQLALIRALTAGMTAQRREQIEYWLAIAETGPDAPMVNGITSLQSAVAMVRSLYLTRGIADAERAAMIVLEREPEGSEWRYAGLVPLGQARYFAGRAQEAREPLEAARTLPGARRRATTVIALSYLALIELAGGDAAKSERLAREALALAHENGHDADVTAVHPHVALGSALTQGPDLHTAIEHLERAVELALSTGSTYWSAHARLRLAAALHRVGDEKAARDALAAASDKLDALPDLGMLADLHAEISRDLDHRNRREGYRGDDLSEAELRILRGLANGQSLAEIAREHWLSVNTVKSHRRTIYRKLGVNTREELLERTAELGILERAAADDAEVT